MQPTAVGGPRHDSRHSRRGAPAGPPRRSEAAGVAAVALVLAHLLVAQLTLMLAACLLVTGKVTRWRPSWLAAPAAAGLVWMLAIGPGRAASGLAAGPSHVLHYLAGPGAGPSRLLTRPWRAFSGWTRWLPRQAPVALLAAAAEAALLSSPGWRKARPDCRPGLITAARRRYVTASIGRGWVVTSDGGSLGVDEATGSRASVSWREASHGVLLTGHDAAALAGSGLALAAAAIQRRKAVIVIDLTGSRALAAAILAGCESAGAPARQFGTPGGGYEPVLAAADYAIAASLVHAMIDWTGASSRQRQFCADYLDAAAAVCAATASPDGRRAGLGDLIAVLAPGELRARLDLVPGYWPGDQVLAERAARLAGDAAGSPAPVEVLAGQLALLRGSAAGQWLRAPGRRGEAKISFPHALRQREVIVFSLDRRADGGSASMIARLAAADLAAALRDRAALAAPADCLAWIHGCEALDPRQLTELIELGLGTGTARGGQHRGGRGSCQPARHGRSRRGAGAGATRARRAGRGRVTRRRGGQRGRWPGALRAAR